MKTPGGKTDQTQPSKHLNIKFEDYSEVKCNQTSSVKTRELEKFLEVPWEVPKHCQCDVSQVAYWQQ